MFPRLPQATRSTFAPRLEGGRILEHDASAKDGFDIKVLLGQDGLVYKFFRIRRFLSSNLFSPYARRFERNGRRLIERGLVAPDVRECCWLPDLRRQVAIYPWIEGLPMRDCLEQAPTPDESRKILFELGAFLAGLHDQGILFHAGHLNNYLRLEGSPAFGLIDVTDVYFLSHSLKRSQRADNLRKLAKGKPNRRVLGELGWESLLEGYQDQLGQRHPKMTPITPAELNRP